MSDAASTDLNDCAFDYPAFLRAHEEAARQKSSANLVPCRAPMVMLVIDPDGEVRACEYSHRALREPPETSLKDIWTGDDIDSLRTSITAKTLPRDHCSHCATCFSAGEFLHAPALHAYSNLQAPEDLKDPKTIVCRLPEKGVWNVSLLGQLPGLFAKADLVTLEADSPLTNPTGAQLLAMIRGLSRHDRPKVSVRAKILPEVEEARDLLRDIRLTGIEIRYQKDLESELQKASQLCEGETALSTKMLIDQDSWFDLVRVANICTENNAKLNICVTTNQGLMPLARLPLEEMFAVHSMITSWWPLMEEGCRPASLDPAAFTLLTEELRNGILSLSQMAVNDDAVSIVAGSGARFLLPEPDHSFFDADSIASVMGVLAHLRNSPSVLDWIRGQARAPESAKLAATHPWFRTLLQKLLIESPLPERSATTILRKLYGTPRGRKQILDEDHEFATKIHTQGWCELLGLDRPLKRTPPFKIGEPIEPTTDDLKKADVTVLVPSFRHEEWIEQTLRSVLAQTYSRFKLLIVDDCSPDNTAKKARSLKDPRIKVQINETGLGLGSSMLGALDDIDTPYVAVLNSDDLFHPERLERCLAILKNSSSVHLVSTGISLIDANSEELTPENASQVLDGKNISDWVQWFDAVRPSPDEAVSFENLLASNVLASSSNMVCRTDFLRSLADEIKGLKYCVDWQTFLRASIDGSLHYIHDPLLAYRLHTGNTVWFERDHRWDYFLEANRVAARNLRYFFTRPGEHPDDQKLTSILNIMVSHLESNDELFGSALYINELFADLDIAEIAQNNPQAKAFLKRLELTCQEAQSITKHINSAGWRAQDILPQLHWIPTLRANKVLAQALEDDLSATKGSQEWFRGYAHELETKVGEHWERHGRDEAEIAGLREHQNSLASDLSSSVEKAAHFEKLWNTLSEERDSSQEKIDEAKAELDEAKASLQQGMQDLNESQRERDDLVAHQFELASEQEQLHGQLAELDQTIAEMRSSHRQELDETYKKREWRTGNFLWNKLPLVAYMARRGKKWYRKSQVLGGRTVTFLKRLFTRKQPQPTAVVSACWDYPHFAHTFVYQEMLSLLETGMDLKLFYWKQSDEAVHGAFQKVDSSKQRLHSVDEYNRANKTHFHKTRPERMEALMKAISHELGWSIEDLGENDEFLCACTFARHAEQAGADYLHTYFFYDQSFMALITAWLLDIPRGVSCYADHMMDDHPLKLVKLHMETADVVVATSRRIKRELLDIAGEQFDSKIIVKPNGVDGRRFDPTAHAKFEHGRLEMVSISRIEQKKGLITLVDAIDVLKRNGRDVHVHVVGNEDIQHDGSSTYAERFRQRIRDLKLEDHFTLHGSMSQEEISDLLKSMHLFVAPYVETETGDKDGIPTAMLEAMAAGLPVVASDAGSMTEVIENNVEGYVVPQRDADRFAAAIEKFIEQPQLLESLGQRAHERFLREFDASVTEKSLHARIQKLLGKKGKALRS